MVMAKRMILAIAALLVFGLAVVTVAYTSGGWNPGAAACCCCNGESCPMKNKDNKDTKAQDAHKSCCAHKEHKDKPNGPAV